MQEWHLRWRLKLMTSQDDCMCVQCATNSLQRKEVCIATNKYILDKSCIRVFIVRNVLPLSNTWGNIWTCMAVNTSALNVESVLEAVRTRCCTGNVIVWGSHYVNVQLVAKGLQRHVLFLTNITVRSCLKAPVIRSIKSLLKLLRSRTHADYVPAVFRSLANCWPICRTRTLQVLGWHVRSIGQKKVSCTGELLNAYEGGSCMFAANVQSISVVPLSIWWTERKHSVMHFDTTKKSFVNVENIVSHGKLFYASMPTVLL